MGSSDFLTIKLASTMSHHRHSTSSGSSAFSIISAVSSVEAEVQQAKIRHQVLQAEHEELKALAAARKKEVERETLRNVELKQAQTTNSMQLGMKKTVLSQLQQHKQNLLQSVGREAKWKAHPNHIVHEKIKALQAEIAAAVKLDQAHQTSDENRPE